ncbi:MAG TPA: LLM class F420-dependent oxidoreductase [Acidimicrobiia bacterium]
MDLSGIGIWSGELRHGDDGEKREAAAELEALGYTAAWLPDVGGDVFGALRDLLDATTTLVAATGILNLWMHTAAHVGEGFAALEADHAGRTLLGIGVSHHLLIDNSHPGEYTKPLAKTRAYLDELDEVSPTVPPERRVLAALGPKMLGLARDRARGAHPYLVTPEHTAVARAELGDGPLLAPEQHVVLETDAGKARAVAREGLSLYLQLPNYVNNWRRLGFTEDDFADGGSDRLIDHVVVWGDEAAIAARVQAHLDAGADHVCVQAYTGADRPGFPRAEWRALAPALVGLTRR